MHRQEYLTGRSFHKKKWFGMVLMVEVAMVENEIMKRWKKATEEDMVELSIINQEQAKRQMR